MDRFKVPEGSSYTRAIEMIVAEVNVLLERLQKLETRPIVRRDPSVACECDALYTGQHTRRCPLFGERV